MLLPGLSTPIISFSFFKKTFLSKFELAATVTIVSLKTELIKQCDLRVSSISIYSSVFLERL